MVSREAFKLASKSCLPNSLRCCCGLGKMFSKNSTLTCTNFYHHLKGVSGWSYIGTPSPLSPCSQLPSWPRLRERERYEQCRQRQAERATNIQEAYRPQRFHLFLTYLPFFASTFNGRIKRVKCVQCFSSKSIPKSSACLFCSSTHVYFPRTMPSLRISTSLTWLSFGS